jgi:hypothetical protein
MRSLSRLKRMPWIVVLVAAVALSAAAQQTQQGDDLQKLDLSLLQRALCVSEVGCHGETAARRFDHLSSRGFHSADAEREMTMLGNVSMSPGTITALAAIFGLPVGALGSSITTWITQRHQDRRDLLARKIFHREQRGGSRGDGRLPQGASYFSALARRARLQYPALDCQAQGRPLCRHGATRPSRTGYPRILPSTALGSRNGQTDEL